MSEHGIITREFAEEVRSAADIVKVISRYVALKRKGDRYWGCCPFHNEKTGSFSDSISSPQQNKTISCIR